MLEATSVAEARGRLRFVDFTLDRQATGSCSARVVLSWPEAKPFVGESAGLSSQAGEMRCAALACLAAICQAHPDHPFELVGVKAVRAFDATVVIASLAGPGRDGARIVGSALVQDDAPRGAVYAVLHATNRLLAGAPDHAS